MPGRYQYRAGTNDLDLRMESQKGQGTILKSLPWAHPPFT